MKYAVIVNRSIYIEGDERSRTNPGHGYGAHTENYKELVEFDTEEALKKWILRNENEKFRAIQFEDVEFVREITVKKKPVYRGTL
jgi:hypothetical protein